MNDAVTTLVDPWGYGWVMLVAWVVFAGAMVAILTDREEER
jgi:hypothetical protein